MATTINSYSVALALNASDYIKNSSLSKSETNSLRRAITEAKSPMEKYAQTYDLLEKALAKQTISLTTYQRLLEAAQTKRDGLSQAEMRAREAAKRLQAETERVNNLMREGERVTRSLATAEEKLAAELRQISALHRQGAVSQETYNRAVERYRTGVAQASVVTQAHRTELSQVTNTVGRLASAYVGLAGAQRGLQMVQARMAEVDLVAKSARGIGEATNQLQRFQFAVAELGGIDGNTAITMLSKLNQRVGEASLGIGEAKANFDRLGISIDNIAKLSPVAQFELLSAAIRQVKNPAEQAALATKFFEEAGSKLLPVMTASAAAYADSASQVDKLGLAISDLDVQKLEATNDALARTTASTKGLAQSIASTGGLAWSINLAASALAKFSALNDLGNFASFGGGDIQKFKSIADRLGLSPQIPAGQGDPTQPDYVNRLTMRMGDMEKAISQKRIQGPPLPDFEKFAQPATKMADAAATFADSMRSVDRFASAAKMAGSSLLAGFGQLGRAIVRSQVESSKAVSMSASVRPANPGMEVGSPEAAAHIARSMNDAMKTKSDKEAKAVELQEQAVKDGKEANKLLTLMRDAIKDNGFKRIR